MSRSKFLEATRPAGEYCFEELYLYRTRRGKSITIPLEGVNLFRFGKDYNRMSKFEHYLKQYVWAGDKYPRELVVFRGPRFIDGALASPGDRWLLKNQTGSQRNGVYVVLKDEVNHISYTTQGGYRVNGKRVDGHNWVNHELDCYRLYPNAPLARRARWSK